MPPSPLSPSCTTLLPLYHAWGQGIAVVKQALNHYLQEGTDTAHASLLTQLSDLTQTQETFLALSQRPSTYQNKTCPQLERLALETIEVLLKHSLNVSSTGQQITRLDLSHSHASAVSLVNACTLVPLLISLQELSCYNTPITALPALPASLQELSCYNTPITALPALPTSLKGLYCFDTPITALPALPTSLERLYCYNTQITALPEPFPEGIRHINIQNTPAASDKKVRAFLQAFQTQHQGVRVWM